VEGGRKLERRRHFETLQFSGSGRAHEGHEGRGLGREERQRDILRVDLESDT